MDAQRYKGVHVSWLISPSIKEYIGTCPIPWMVSVFNTLAVPNAFAWWNYFCKRKKKICLLSKVEKWMRVRLYRNFARHSIKKVEEKQPPFFLSLPCSIKLPLRGGKQQTRLFFLPWGESTSHWGYHWKVKPLRISWKLHSAHTLPVPYWAPSSYHLCYNNISTTWRGDMSSRGVENVRTTLRPFDCREYRWASSTLLMSAMQPVSFAFTVPFRSVTSLCVSFLNRSNFSI